MLPTGFPMIKSIALELTHDEALALRSLIEGFFKYQGMAGIGEGSSRVTLACQLLKVLPQPLNGTEGSMAQKSIKAADE